MAKLTDEQIAQEDKFLKGLPRVNWGAFFMPPIWGPAHGMWATILWYPAWLFADNIFYTAVTAPSPLAIILAVVVGVVLVAATIIFAIVSQPFAAHRAENMGVSRETYLKRQRIWAVVMFFIALLFVVLATIYNINVRPTIDLEGL